MRKIREVLRLKYEAGLGERPIADALGVVRSTVQECLRRAREAGVSWPLPIDLSDAALEARLYPVERVAPSFPRPDFAQVHTELQRKGVTRMLLWQEYRVAHPDGCEYSAFCDHYRAWAQTRDAVLRQTHAPGDYASWKKAKVHIDYHVEIERRYYSVPYGLIGRTVDVRMTASALEIFHRGQRVAAHPRSSIRGSFTTQPEHRSPRHQAVVELSHERLLRDAEGIGAATAAVIRQQAFGRVHPEHTLRRSLGILRLAKDFDAVRLEAACLRALSLGSTSYRSIRALIQAPVQTTLPGLSLPVHDNLRGPSYYQ